MARQRPAKIKIRQYTHCRAMMVATQKGNKINTDNCRTITSVTATSVNPNNAWYSLASQYNKALKRDSRKNAASPLALALYA